MAQTEVGEVAESAEQGPGGSSTMPQKSNPITSELILRGGAHQRCLIIGACTRHRFKSMSGRPMAGKWNG